MKIIFTFFICLFSLGLVISQTNNQKKDSVVNYTDINGKRQGNWEKKFDNEKPAYKAYFINSIPVGGYIRYYYSGGVMAKINYLKDKSGNGKAILYWDDGLIMAEGNYVNIKVKDSIWNMYSADSALIVKIKYDKGIKNGREIKYFRNSYPSEMISWTKGIKDGVWRWYYDNGKTRMETKYKMGKQDGLFRAYFESGQIYIQGHYENNKRIGTWKFYDAHENIEKELEYLNGKAKNEYEIEMELSNKLQEWKDNKGNIPEPTIKNMMNSGKR
jgi:antitoxin component YwqK of YwqJK toxin-antitoxin module